MWRSLFYKICDSRSGDNRDYVASRSSVDRLVIFLGSCETSLVRTELHNITYTIILLLNMDHKMKAWGGGSLAPGAINLGTR